MSEFPLREITFDQRMIALLTQLCEEQDGESMDISNKLWDSPISDISWNTQDGMRDTYDQEGLVPRT